MTDTDRFWYAAGALTVAVIGVELAHRYWFPLLDSAWRSAETLARRYAA